MPVTAKFYGNAFVHAFNKRIDLDSDAIKVALCTATYVPDQDLHDYFDDVTNQVVGTGYTAGGATLTTPTLVYTAPTNVLKFDADDVSWANSTITARYAVIYDATPATAATQPLIAYVDFGADVVSSAGAFTITWHADGIVTVTVA